MMITYPWPDAKIIKASTSVKRHKKGSEKGGWFAPKQVESVGVTEVDKAKLSYIDYNRARVKAAKMKKRVDDSGGKDESLNRQLKNLESNRDLLKAQFTLAKVEANRKGYKIDSRGDWANKPEAPAPKPVSNRPVRPRLTDSPSDDLATHIEQENELLGKSIEQKPLGEGGSIDDATGGGMHTADKPILHKLANGKFAVRKVDGQNEYSHAHSEVVVSRLSTLLGIGNVPITAMKKHGDAHISSQEFVTGAKVASDEMSEIGKTSFSVYPSHMKREKSIGRYRTRYAEQLDDIFILDSIVGNTDRHTGNIIQKDGKLHAIDNGRSVIGRDKSGRRLALDNNTTSNSISAHAIYDFGFNASSGRVPVRREVLDRWKRIEKSDFEMALNGIDANINIETAWDNFVQARNDGELKIDEDAMFGFD